MAIAEDIPISFHVAESKEEEEFIGKRSGVIQKFLETRASDWQILGNTSISHLSHTGIFDTKPLIAHLVQATEPDMDLLKRYSVHVAHCPKSNARFAHGIAPVVKMLEHGLPVSLGTDSAASNNRFDLFEEARFALSQQKAAEGKSFLSEQQLLEMMTIRGAEALGMEKAIGSLEKGKQADLIAVKIPSYLRPEQVLHHLIQNTTSRDVFKTMIAGSEIRPSDPGDKVQDLLVKLS